MQVAQVRSGVLAGIALAAIACGDDAATDATSSSAGSGAAGPGDSVTFIAVESIAETGEPTPGPLVGAAVAFDAPGGTRIEKVTGADGKVTFDGIDWSLGKAAVTAYLDGHALMSLVDLDESRLALERHLDEAVALLLYIPAAPETVTMTGTLTGLQDSAHLAFVRVAQFPGAVETAAAYEWAGTATGTFSVSVPKGAAFSLQAVEKSAAIPLPSGQGQDVPIHQIMDQSFPATTTDMTGVVLDFATSALPLETVDVSVATPTRATSPVRAGFGDTCASPINSVYCTGHDTHIDISADENAFDATITWTEPDWATGPSYLVRVFGPDGILSSRRKSGWPVAGLMGTLPDVPEWVTPADTKLHPLHEAIEWKLFDTGVPRVRLRLTRNNAVVWNVDAGPDATSLTVPQPPSAVDVAAVFGSSLHGNVVPLWIDAATYQADAFSFSDQAFFEP